VFGIIESDGNEISCAGEARADTDAGGCKRQSLRIDRGPDMFETSGSDCLRRDVEDVVGYIADLSGAIEDARLIQPHRAET